LIAGYERAKTGFSRMVFTAFWVVKDRRLAAKEKALCVPVFYYIRERLFPLFIRGVS
jgi:hypothetical protein